SILGNSRLATWTYTRAPKSEPLVRAGRRCSLGTSRASSLLHGILAHKTLFQETLQSPGEALMNLLFRFRRLTGMRKLCMSILTGTLLSLGVAAASEDPKPNRTLVEWNGSYWPASVIQPLRDGRLVIHYKGWSEEYDEIVRPARVRHMAPAGKGQTI